MGYRHAARTRALRILAIATLLLHGVPAFAQETRSLEEAYPEASQRLIEQARLGALEMIGKRRGDGVNRAIAPRAAIQTGLEAVWEDLFAFAVADAVGTNLSAEHKSVIEERQGWLLETTATDRQIGASSGANAAVSLVEKPSFSKLLGFAVEHGALQQEESGTNLTLSTTPYALGLVATGAEDTAENYQRIPYLNWLGASASFPLDKSNDEGLNGLELSELSEFSIRITPWDRTTRAPAYNEMWHKEVGPAVDRKFSALNALVEDILDAEDANDDAGLRRQELSDSAQEKVEESLITTFAPSLAGALPPEAEKITELREKIAKEILARLEAEVGKQIVDADGKPVAALIPADLVARIKQELIPALDTATTKLDGATAAFDKLAKQWQKRKAGSLIYTNHQIEGSSDHSSITLAYQGPLQFRGFGFTEAVVNGSLSLYHDPSSVMKQDTVRDYNVTFSFERSFGDLPRLDTLGADPVTIAVSGEFKRVEETKADIGTAQMKLSLPLVSGFALPVALTYNTRTEEDEDDEFRVNFGVNLDTDKLSALLRLRR